MNSVRASEILRLMVALVFFVAAPTVGDIGSCSQPEDDLDPAKFFPAKQALDCQRCLDCEITTDACNVACGAVNAQDFPKGCVPLVHDGEVCLDALDAATCADYARFMADQEAIIPTECNFCPPLGAGGGGGAGGAP